METTAVVIETCRFHGDQTFVGTIWQQTPQTVLALVMKDVFSSHRLCDFQYSTWQDTLSHIHG